MSAPATEPTYHEGVVYGIAHPGPSQMGCTYCIETLQLALTFPTIATPTEGSQP